MTPTSEVSAALDPLREMLAPDGFGIDVHEETKEIRIVATDDACGDCLVPEPVLRALMADMLGRDDDVSDWSVTLPSTDSHA